MSTNIPALKTAKSIDRDADVVVIGLTSVGGTSTLVGVLADLEKAWSKQLPSSLLEAAIVLGARSELGALVTLPRVRFDVSFSEQKKSTDTIAADTHNEPFRDEDGSLVLRPQK